MWQRKKVMKSVESELSTSYNDGNLTRMKLPLKKDFDHGRIFRHRVVIRNDYFE